MSTKPGLRGRATWPAHSQLGGILLLGLAHGLLFTFLVPPWQHYDEPAHFEYAWLIAHRGRLPQPGEYDPAMRRETAASMLEYGFFDSLGFEPNLLAPDPWIGISQLADPPAFPLAVSLPLRFLRFASVTTQLYAARLVSLGMYLLTLALAYALVREITLPGNPLRWMAPAGIALTPAFTDLMTAVNNDVGATLAFSLFLWLGVRLMGRGVRWGRAVGLIVATALCLATKSTVYVAAPLAGVLLVLLLTRENGWRKWLPAGLVLLFAGGLGGLALTRQHAAAWYWGNASSPAMAPTQAARPEAPLGAHALRLALSPGSARPPMAFQPLPARAVAEIQGKTVTLGMWMWASAPVSARAPALWTGSPLQFETLALTTTPAFFSFTSRVPPQATRAQVVVEPVSALPEEAVSIFLDGLVLVRGGFAGAGPPEFSDPSGGNGTWEGVPFVNSIRNASAEARWMTLRPEIETRILRVQPKFPGYALPALQDAGGLAQVYLGTAANLFQSFWARFGWNQIRLPGGWYRALAGISLVGLAGAGVGVWGARKRIGVRRGVGVGWLLGAAVLVWLAALLRAGLPIWNAELFVPSARYAYPVITPTMLAVVGGWQILGGRMWETRAGQALFWGAWALFDGLCLVMVYRAYYG